MMFYASQVVKHMYSFCSKRKNSFVFLCLCFTFSNVTRNEENSCFFYFTHEIFSGVEYIQNNFLCTNSCETTQKLQKYLIYEFFDMLLFILMINLGPSARQNFH